MDNIKQLYLSFDDRIGRKAFWLGILGLVVVGIILAFIFRPLFGTSLFNGATMMSTDPNIDANTLAQNIMDLQSKSGWANLLTFVILIVPLSALFIKRRHDRGASGMEYWVYAALALLMILLQVSGMGYSVLQLSGISMPVPNMITTIVSLITMALGLYLLIVAGFLKGNEGDNSYGKDPLNSN